MRNLKRALSLVLASVMLLGMMVIGSSAAQSYPDVDDSYNTEAIDVLKVVNVMSGYAEDGLFHPDDNVNRAMMARIMAELLNLDYDYYEAIPSQFTDVTGNYSWAKKYVDACAANGIIYGRGNGIYDPASSVTAVEAASMMMRALGYFQHIEDNEGNFEAATVKQASQIGLFSGINGNAHDALNRNQIAKLALNTLESNMVYFTGDMGFEINGVKMGYRSEYSYRTGTEAKYSAIHGLGDAVRLDNTTGLAQGQYYINLGEQLYDGKLKLSATTDDFYRPSRIWEYDGKEIGTYLRKDLLREEYTVKVTGKELYDLLTKETVAKYDFVISIDGETERDILNGNSNVDQFFFSEKNLVRTNTEGVGGTGNGVLTQVFVDPEAGQNGTVYISVINTYFAVAANNYNEKKDQVDLKVYGVEEVTKTIDGVSVDALVKNISGTQSRNLPLMGDEFDIVDIEKDDAFLVNVAGDRIVRIGDVTMLEDETINLFKVGDYVTTPDKQYDYASTALYDPTVLYAYDKVNMKETTYNLFLDQYGYLIGLEIVDKPTNYLFLAGVDTKTTNRQSATAEGTALFLDGTVGDITINLEKSLRVNNAGTNWEKTFSDICSAVMNTWCTYTVDSKGVYTLVEVANTDTTVDKSSDDQATPERLGQSRVVANGDTLATANDGYIATLGGTIDSKHPSTPGVASSDFQTVYGTEDTVYLVAEVKEIEAYHPTAKNTGYTKTSDNRGYAVIISGVDSFGVGYQEVDLKAYNALKVLGVANTVQSGRYTNLGAYTDEVSQSTNYDLAKISYGVYNLFDKSGFVIAAVVVGEDQGSNSQYAYVVSSSVRNEGYSAAEDEWTWTRDVIINGEEVTLKEKGDTNPDLNTMVLGAWYEVKYKADGTVKSATPIDWDWNATIGVADGIMSGAKDFFDANGTAAAKFIGHMNKVEASITANNTVVLSHNLTGTTNSGATLYPIDPEARRADGVATTNTLSLKHSGLTLQVYNGNTLAWSIPVNRDAKVVLIQDKQIVSDSGASLLKVEPMKYIEIWDNGGDKNGSALDSLIDELEKNDYFVGFVSAVFENGPATSVVVWDQTPHDVDIGATSGKNEGEWWVMDTMEPVENVNKAFEEGHLKIKIDGDWAPTHTTNETAAQKVLKIPSGGTLYITGNFDAIKNDVVVQHKDNNDRLGIGTLRVGKTYTMSAKVSDTINYNVEAGAMEILRVGTRTYGEMGQYDPEQEAVKINANVTVNNGNLSIQDALGEPADASVTTGNYFEVIVSGSGTVKVPNGDIVALDHDNKNTTADASRVWVRIDGPKGTVTVGDKTTGHNANLSFSISSLNSLIVYRAGGTGGTIGGKLHTHNGHVEAYTVTGGVWQGGEDDEIVLGTDTDFYQTTVGGSVTIDEDKYEIKVAFGSADNEEEKVTLVGEVKTLTTEQITQPEFTSNVGTGTTISVADGTATINTNLDTVKSTIEDDSENLSKFDPESENTVGGYKVSANDAPSSQGMNLVASNIVFKAPTLSGETIIGAVMYKNGNAILNVPETGTATEDGVSSLTGGLQYYVVFGQIVETSESSGEYEYSSTPHTSSGKLTIQWICQSGTVYEQVIDIVFNDTAESN